MRPAHHWSYRGAADAFDTHAVATSSSATFGDADVIQLIAGRIDVDEGCQQPLRRDGRTGWLNSPGLTPFSGDLEMRRANIDHLQPTRPTDPPLSAPTKKRVLAAIRKFFFDIAVTRHAVALNPALSVRGPKHQVVEGKTPEISVDQARRLLASIDISNVVGLRDRAILATMIYTGRGLVRWLGKGWEEPGDSVPA